jgi:hypothetical protein
MRARQDEPRDLGWLAGMPCSGCRRHLPPLTGSIEEVLRAAHLRQWALFHEGSEQIQRTNAARWIRWDEETIVGEATGGAR